MTQAMTHLFLCHYHEIALKKKNRHFFEKQLCHNIRQALNGLRYGSVRRVFGRVVVELDRDSPVGEIGRRLRKVFGIASLAQAWSCPPTLEAMQAALLELIAERKFQTFKIHARRANKSFYLTSPEMNQRLGAAVVREMGRNVRLENPDLTCFVHVVNRRAFIYFHRRRGLGGLPVGSSGRVTVLLSGGLDSPVAAYQIIKRGCSAQLVHFHSFPHTPAEAQQKVRLLVAKLSEYQYSSRLILVPFAAAQRQVVAMTPAETRVLLYRRLMLRVAEKLAAKHRSLALVTGESIGQVASQTLENIRVIGRVTRLPILRPLIGSNKEEIVELARRLGTFEIAASPEEDCCSLFVPLHPETRATLRQIEKAEAALEIDKMVQDMCTSCLVEKITQRPADTTATVTH